MKINVGGVNIDNVTKSEAIERIDGFIKSGEPHYVVTPYSEMIVFASNSENYRQVLNAADLSLADGVGILWAAKYLSLKNTFFSVFISLAAIVFDPNYIRSVIREQITGSRLIYDLAELAQEKNYSVALVGGQGNVAAQAAYELKKLYPNLNIKLALSGRPFDAQIVKEITDSNSDILLVAYSPPKQEIWLAQNLQNLNNKVAIGLGGTFDYLAGIRRPAPNFMHYTGLEWLWRLMTQPWRFKRMWNAVPVFIWKIYIFKLKHNAARSTN
ncbi:MAG: WecB/TagA/CpsF family glycosyltransferase [Candidatus Doudnabacteria bacterium]